MHMQKKYQCYMQRISRNVNLVYDHANRYLDKTINGWIWLLMRSATIDLRLLIGGGFCPEPL